MSGHEPFYAASPHRSGVFFFATMDEADLWVKQHDGLRLNPEQVDLAVRAHAHRELGLEDTWVTRGEPFLEELE